MNSGNIVGLYFSRMIPKIYLFNAVQLKVIDITPEGSAFDYFSLNICIDLFDFDKTAVGPFYLTKDWYCRIELLSRWIG